ncbi:MAG: MFS transporter [Hyphomicrobiales bacterium]|nr:MFS transporter [Hyphomicrobiales bacterium]
MTTEKRSVSQSGLWLTVIAPFGLGFAVAVAGRSINAILGGPIAEALDLNNLEIGLATSTFMLGFALTQLPLGLLLDYLGPRTTQALFFVVGGLGMILFAMASGVVVLLLGRALLGIGVAGGLMAAFKAVADRVETERLPFYNGVILACGGLGAIAATSPAKWFEIAYGWRALCIVVGVVIILTGIFIYVVNRDAGTANPRGLRSDLKGLARVYREPLFWHIAPLFTVSFGGFLALQSLWLGPWLQTVVGLSPSGAAQYLLATAAAMTVGMLSGGLFSRVSEITKQPLSTIVFIGTAAYVVFQLAIVANIAPGNIVVWLAYGFLSQITLLNFAILGRHFPPELAGRAMTGLNVLVFLYAFVAQLGFGVIAHLWSGGARDSIEAYQVAFSCLIAIEIVALAWYGVQAMRRRYGE